MKHERVLSCPLLILAINIIQVYFNWRKILQPNYAYHYRVLKYDPIDKMDLEFEKIVLQNRIPSKETEFGPQTDPHRQDLFPDPF